MYADDLLIMAETKEEAEQTIKALEELKKAKLVLNHNKT
jgi:hypothetical protein